MGGKQADQLVRLPKQSQKKKWQGNGSQANMTRTIGLARLLFPEAANRVEQTRQERIKDGSIKPPWFEGRKYPVSESAAELTTLQPSASAAVDSSLGRVTQFSTSDTPAPPTTHATIEADKTLPSNRTKSPRTAETSEIGAITQTQQNTDTNLTSAIAEHHGLGGEDLS